MSTLTITDIDVAGTYEEVLEFLQWALQLGVKVTSVTPEGPGGGWPMMSFECPDEGTAHAFLCRYTDGDEDQVDYLLNRS